MKLIKKLLHILEKNILFLIILIVLVVVLIIILYNIIYLYNTNATNHTQINKEKFDDYIPLITKYGSDLNKFLINIQQFQQTNNIEMMICAYIPDIKIKPGDKVSIPIYYVSQFTLESLGFLLIKQNNFFDYSKPSPFKINLKTNDKLEMNDVYSYSNSILSYSFTNYTSLNKLTHPELAGYLELTISNSINATITHLRQCNIMICTWFVSDTQHIDKVTRPIVKNEYDIYEPSKYSSWTSLQSLYYYNGNNINDSIPSDLMYILNKAPYVANSQLFINKDILLSLYFNPPYSVLFSNTSLYSDTSALHDGNILISIFLPDIKVNPGDVCSIPIYYFSEYYINTIDFVIIKSKDFDFSDINLLKGVFFSPSFNKIYTNHQNTNTRLSFKLETLPHPDNMPFPNQENWTENLGYLNVKINTNVSPGTNLRQLNIMGYVQNIIGDFPDVTKTPYVFNNKPLLINNNTSTESSVISMSIYNGNNIDCVPKELINQINENPIINRDNIISNYLSTGNLQLNPILTTPSNISITNTNTNTNTTKKSAPVAIATNKLSTTTTTTKKPAPAAANKLSTTTTTKKPAPAAAIATTNKLSTTTTTKKPAAAAVAAIATTNKLSTTTTTKKPAAAVAATTNKLSTTTTTKKPAAVATTTTTKKPAAAATTTTTTKKPAAAATTTPTTTIKLSTTTAANKLSTTTTIGNSPTTTNKLSTTTTILNSPTTTNKLSTNTTTGNTTNTTTGNTTNTTIGNTTNTTTGNTNTNTTIGNSSPTNTSTTSTTGNSPSPTTTTYPPTTKYIINSNTQTTQPTYQKPRYLGCFPESVPLILQVIPIINPPSIPCVNFDTNKNMCTDYLNNYANNDLSNCSSYAISNNYNLFGIEETITGKIYKCYFGNTSTDDINKYNNIAPDTNICNPSYYNKQLTDPLHNIRADGMYWTNDIFLVPLATQPATTQPPATTQSTSKLPNCNTNTDKPSCNTTNNCYFINNKCISPNDIASLNDINSSDIACFIDFSTTANNVYVLSCANKNKNVNSKNISNQNIIIKAINIGNTCKYDNTNALLTNDCNILLPIKTQSTYNVKDYLYTFDQITNKLTISPQISLEQLRIIKNNNNKITLVDIQDNQLIVTVDISNNIR